jgi:sugar/nucleoside kinase (ribokinase family)
MRVTVLGGAAWNRMIHVERLPDGRSATIHPLRHHEAIGGAGAGKAMNLARLGVAVTLHAGIGDDEAGRQVRAGLATAGVDLRATTDPTGTARHVNLMDPAGGRISIMLANGSPDLSFDEAELADSMADADVVVVDLAPWTPRAISLARASGWPIWTDLHDHDGSKEWHAPFIDAAEVVFVSHDRLASPAAFLESLIGQGKRLAVCTMAAAGAIALAAKGRAYEIPAVPDVEIVDTNGAGDAFFAGVLFGVLSSLPLERALRYGAVAGGLAVTSPDLASADLSPDRITTEAI